MTDLNIAIVAGSTRPGRHSRMVADWVLDRATGRSGVRYDIVDLTDHPLPLFDEATPPSFGQYQNAHTKAWAATIAPFDGFVFVSPEYNHSTSAALKNALDYLYAEWQNKAAALVGYGSLSGTRAVEHLRLICAELQMATVRQQLAFSLFNDFQNFTSFAPAARHDDAADAMFTQLENWAGALKPLRA
ncbi:NADPH-dependent FMN reductase [Rhodococcus sp. NPDC127528]|uniref:NADPH-dependent FMN reductase n=1 Tax=unclassified Rhodococcus (in: high G+C Gram-positive bacteria) TaxID=192944 RepID=UPI00362DD3FE